MLKQIRLKKKLPVILWTIVATILLSGCVQLQSNVAIYGDQEWAGIQQIKISSEFVEMMEQEGGEAEGLNEWLTMAEESSKRSDVDITVEETTNADGSRSYTMEAQGKGFDILNEILFQDKAEISTQVVNGKLQVSISYIFSDDSEEAQTLSAEEMEQQKMMMDMIGIQSTFRISGGEIISSNATKVEGATAIWESPIEINITLTPATDLNPDALALVEQPFKTPSFPQDGEFSFDSSDSFRSDGSVEVTDTSNNAIVSNDPAPITSAESNTEDNTISNADTGATESAPANTSDTTDTTTAPPEDEQNLPQSGGVLPESTPISILVLATLMILILCVGAVSNLIQREGA